MGSQNPAVGNAHPFRHLLAMEDLDRDEILSIFDVATSLEHEREKIRSRSLLGKTVAVMFFQPSTRTRLGFEVAALRLGAKIIGFADPASSSSVDFRSETLEDAVRVVSEMADIVIVRHFRTGAASRAAAASKAPVINAGDGTNEHPTQALSDIWAITRRLGNLSKLTIGIMGDPNTRVLRSLTFGLIKLGVGRILFLIPPGFAFALEERSDLVHASLPEDIKLALGANGTPYSFCSSLEDLLVQCNAIEMMPVAVPSLERDPQELRPIAYSTPERFRLTADKIAKASSRALILHPGPRSDELDTSVDQTPNSLYFAQVSDAILMRMSILEWISDGGGTE